MSTAMEILPKAPVMSTEEMIAHYQRSIEKSQTDPSRVSNATRILCLSVSVKCISQTYRVFYYCTCFLVPTAAGPVRRTVCVMSNDSCCTNIDESKIDGALCANLSHYVYVQLG